MKPVCCLFLSLMFASAAAYAEDKKTDEMTDPVEILKKVDAATKAVKSVKFDSVVEATGALAAQVGKIEASFIISGFAQIAPEKYRAEAKITLPGASEPLKISGGTDNDMFFLVDHQGKKAYVDLDPAVMGTSARVFQQAWMIEFVHATPFNDEIVGKSQELKGSEKIGGEDCYVIHVVYAVERAPEATWYFSKKDLLPRRRIDTITMPTGDKATMVKTISNLVVDPKLSDDMFKLKLPEGYTQTDDFAPDVLPRR